MALFNELKTIATVLQEAGKIELYEKILLIQQQLLDMQNEIAEKDNIIKELNNILKIKDEIFFKGNAYWRKKTDGKNDGPYCSGCWDNNNKLIHLHHELGTNIEKDFWICPACNIGTIVQT